MAQSDIMAGRVVSTRTAALRPRRRHGAGEWGGTGAEDLQALADGAGLEDRHVEDRDAVRLGDADGHSGSALGASSRQHGLDALSDEEGSAVETAEADGAAMDVAQRLARG